MKPFSELRNSNQADSHLTILSNTNRNKFENKLQQLHIGFITGVTYIQTYFLFVFDSKSKILCSAVILILMEWI